MSEIGKWLPQILILAAVTALLRFLPFLIFGGKKKTPVWVGRLGKVLPAAVMGMLIVYCLKDTELAGASHGLPELIACAVTAGLHLLKKNTLISILGGTLSYMLLVQLVFA